MTDDEILEESHNLAKIFSRTEEQDKRFFELMEENKTRSYKRIYGNNQEDKIKKQLLALSAIEEKRRNRYSSGD